MRKVEIYPDDFLETISTEYRADMKTLDQAITQIMQDEPRVLWQGQFWGGSEQSIIGYGDLIYKNSNKTDVYWFKVGLALQKQYISVYLSGVEDGKYLAEQHGESIARLGAPLPKVGKSSIGFQKLDHIDLQALLDLVQRSQALC